MSKSTQRPVLVQKLITSYFPTREVSFDLLSVSTAEVGSVFSKYTSDSGYVSETPVSKQGKTDFYLGHCNTAEESPRRALFMSPRSSDSANSYPTTSFEYTPSLSNVRTSLADTGSCESMVF